MRQLRLAALVVKKPTCVSLIIAFMMVSCFAATASETGKVEGWLLEQRSQTDGNFTIVFSESGIKLTQGDVICTCSAPDWTASIANAKTKIGMAMPITEWAVAGFHVGREDAVRSRVHETSSQWRGQPVSCIVRSVAGVDPLSRQVELGYRGRERGANSYTSEQITVSKWIKLAPPVAEFLDGVYKEPGLKQLLLKRENLYPGGREESNLDTLICRRVLIAPDELRIPFKYRRAKDRDEITMEKARRHMIQGAVKDFFGIDDDAPAKPAH
jgi:hypothetical protein